MPSGEDEFVMIVRDVTDRVVQQRQIETQNEFLGAMGDATTGLLCNLHLDGRIGRDNVNLPLREPAATSSTRSTGASSGRCSSRPRTVLKPSVSSGMSSPAAIPASSRAAG